MQLGAGAQQLAERWPTQPRQYIDLGVLQFKAGGPAQNFDRLRWTRLPSASMASRPTLQFRVETLCTTACYVDGTTGDDTFGGSSAARPMRTIQAAVDQVSPNGSSACGRWHLPRGRVDHQESASPSRARALARFPRSTPLSMARSAAARASTCRIPTRLNVTIRDLRVQEFSNGGICSPGTNNNNFTIESVEVLSIDRSAACQASHLYERPGLGCADHRHISDQQY